MTFHRTLSEAQSKNEAINIRLKAHLSEQFRLITALNAAIIVIWAISAFGAWYALGSWADESSRVWLLDHQEQYHVIRR